MLSEIPIRWHSAPPGTLVFGGSAYAAALSSVLGADLLDGSVLFSPPRRGESEGTPQVLGSLQRVFLVMDGTTTAAEALAWHRGLWKWVDLLSPFGDQHDLAILWILPPQAGATLSEGILAGLGLDGGHDGTMGHAFVAMDTPLRGILEAVVRIVPADGVSLRTRQRADIRHAVLRELCGTLASGNADALPGVAARVLGAFEGREYLLDLFCRPPSHRHGNLLRHWLNRLVTGAVTPHSACTEDDGPRMWLSDSCQRPGA